MCLPCDSSVSALVQRVYSDVQHCSDPEVLMEPSTLAPRHVDVGDNNSYMLHRCRGQVCLCCNSMHRAAHCAAFRLI